MSFRSSSIFPSILAIVGTVNGLIVEGDAYGKLWKFICIQGSANFETVFKILGTCRTAAGMPSKLHTPLSSINSRNLGRLSSSHPVWQDLKAERGESKQGAIAKKFLRLVTKLHKAAGNSTVGQARTLLKQYRFNQGRISKMSRATPLHALQL